MTLTQNVTAKFVVGFVAASMMLLSVAPAKAATMDELKAQITALLAQISLLQGQTGQGGMSVASGVCPYVWNVNLKNGSTGADVMKLQQFLNADVETRVAAAGAGSVGAETSTFGPLTAAAVSKFQTKYRAEVLTPSGLVSATGFFGPSSRAKANMLCSSAPVVVPPPVTGGGTPTATSTPSADLEGEASLKNVDISNGADRNNVEEGSKDAEVADIDIEFNNGDARISRLDIVLDDGSVANTQSSPWKVFGGVSLMVDGKTVATIDASDRANYLDKDQGSLRFSGLDIVGMDSKPVTVTVAVDVAGSVDSTGSATLADWDVYIAELRYTDAQDVTTTDTDTDDIEDGTSATLTGNKAGFTIGAAGNGDDLNLEDADANPQTSTIELSENSNTEKAIFAFDLSANDSDRAVTLDNLISVSIVLATSSGSSAVLSTIVNDFRLEIDGTSYDAESYTQSGLTTTLDFDINGDETIDENTTATAVLFADFNDMANADQGASIYASVAAADIDAEGKNSGETVTVDGSTITGNVHTLRTSGVDVAYVSNTVTAVANNDTISSDNAANFVLNFTVKAFSTSVYLPFGAVGSTTVLTDSVGYSIIDTNTNTVVTTGTSTPGLTTSGGTEVTKNNSFKVGTSPVSFALNVLFDPAATGSYKVRIDRINTVGTDLATATLSQDVSGQNIQTAAITITE